MPARHVLVVDDSKSARLMLRKMLQGLGMTVDTAESGEDALNYLLGKQPDAIFMDHTMPGLDGLAVVRKIRSNPLNAVIPIVMYTSRDELDYRAEALAAGALDVLIKPAIPEVLSALVERVNQVRDAKSTLGAATASTHPGSAILDSALIEKIVLEKSESVFFEAIEQQVLPLINDVIAKLRRDLEAEQASTCQRLAAEVCEQRLASWKPATEPQHPPWNEQELHGTWTRILNNRLETLRRDQNKYLETEVKEFIQQICQDLVHEASEKLTHQFNVQFAEALRKAITAVHESAVEAAQNAAQEEVGSAEEARAVYEEEVAAVMQAQLKLQMDTARGELRRLIYWTASLAALLGISAAALVYWLG